MLILHELLEQEWVNHQVSTLGQDTVAAHAYSGELAKVGKLNSWARLELHLKLRSTHQTLSDDSSEDPSDASTAVCGNGTLAVRGVPTADDDENARKRNNLALVRCKQIESGESRNLQMQVLGALAAPTEMKTARNPGEPTRLGPP